MNNLVHILKTPAAQKERKTGMKKQAGGRKKKKQGGWTW